MQVQQDVLIQKKAYSVSKGQDYINWWEKLGKLEEIEQRVGRIPEHVHQLEDDTRPGQHGWRVAIERRQRLFDLSDALQELYESSVMNATKWVTCACGNQCAAIERDPYGCPTDPELKDLGCEFPKAVANLEIDRAKDILHKIEARSATILNGMK